jgi:FkbM family methyltransferase
VSVEQSQIQSAPIPAGFVLSRWARKLRDIGPLTLLKRRLAWYKRRFQKENWLVGRYVELSGNKVTIRGQRFFVDNPLIETRRKSWMYFGIYELSELDFVERYIDRADAVIEVGGSIGVVSCAVNRKLADPTQHIVVEANPGLIETLKKNRELNQCQFRIECAAVAYGTENVQFQQAENFLGGSVARKDGKSIVVKTTTLKRLVAEMGSSPVSLVCDIEGAELELVRNELAVLRDCIVRIVMETHPGKVGQEANGAMLRTLQDAGFDLLEVSRNVVALLNRHLAGWVSGA